MGLIHSPSLLTNGLIFCLDAANLRSYPGSGTAWYDLKDYSNNGTLINSPTFSTDNNGIFNFDGVNQYVRTTLPYSGSTDYTMSCWFKTSVAQKCGFCGFRTVGTGTAQVPLTWNQFLFYITGDFNAGTSGNYIKYEEFSAGFGFTPFYTRSVFIDSQSVTTGQWINIVATSNSTTSVVYYNAVQVASTQSANQPLRSYPAPFYLGVAPSYSPTDVNGILSTYHFNGSISNASLYNRALTSDEVLQNYNSLKRRFGL